MFFSLGYGLKCYQCESSKSWDDCADVRKEQTCDAGFDRCAKLYANIKKESLSIERYEKTCLPEAWCNNITQSETCKDNDGECKAYCCRGDLCNGAAVQMVSTIILIACALVAAMIQ